MTREERKLSIEYLEGIKDNYIEGYGYERHPLPEYYAIENAIKALEQESTTKNDLGVDCIDRAELLKAMDTWDKFGDDPNKGLIPLRTPILQNKYVPYVKYDDMNNCVKGMPPVTPQEPRWIPVSERLPASDEDVLITNGFGIYVGWIDPTDKRWRADSESEYFMDDIVAWMPLPDPYRAESEVENGNDV